MKIKISRIIFSLFMIVMLLTQLIPFQMITAYAESIETTQTQKSDEKPKTTDSTKDTPPESTSEADKNTSESTNNSKILEKQTEQQSVETKNKVDSDKEKVDLDGSVYGSGAGVPGKQVLLPRARALSPDLPTFFGISTNAITAELTAHQNDSFYLGTPYRGGGVSES